MAEFSGWTRRIRKPPQCTQPALLSFFLWLLNAPRDERQRDYGEDRQEDNGGSTGHVTDTRCEHMTQDMAQTHVASTGHGTGHRHTWRAHGPEQSPQRDDRKPHGVETKEPERGAGGGRRLWLPNPSLSLVCVYLSVYPSIRLAYFRPLVLIQ